MPESRYVKPIAMALAGLFVLYSVLGFFSGALCRK